MILFIYGNDTYRSKEKLDFYKTAYLKKYGDFNVSVYEGDIDPQKVRNDIMSLPFMAEKRLIILKNALASKKDILENLLDLIDQIPEETVVLFYEEGEPDRRTSLYKKLSKGKHIEVFSHLEGSDLQKWIKKEVLRQNGEIDPQAYNLLSAYIGNDLWQLSRELKKLLSFNKKITKESVEELTKSRPEANIFDMVDALGKKDPRTASKKMHVILESGESEIYLLSMIVRQIRNILLVKDLFDKGLREAEIAKTLKLHPFVVKKAVEQGRNFTFSELKDIYSSLAETDLSIKNGTLEPRLALDLLVQKICK